MKIISVEISVSHSDDECDDCAAEPTDSGILTRSVNGEEASSLSLTDCIPDEQPVAPVVEKLTNELLRRYKTLNARKTI